MVTGASRKVVLQMGLHRRTDIRVSDFEEPNNVAKKVNKTKGNA